VVIAAGTGNAVVVVAAAAGRDVVVVAARFHLF